VEQTIKDKLQRFLQIFINFLSSVVFAGEERCLPTSPTQQLLAHQHHILQTSANVHAAAAMIAMENAQKQTNAQVKFQTEESRSSVFVRFG